MGHWRVEDIEARPCDGRVPDLLRPRALPDEPLRYFLV